MKMSVMFVVLCWLALGLPAYAHSMYQTAILLDVHSSHVEAEFQFPRSRLETAYGKPLDNASAYLLARIHATSLSGLPIAVTVVTPPHAAIVDGAPYVVLRLDLRTGSPVFLLDDDVILDTLPAHTALVSVRSDWNSGTFATEPDLIGILTGQQRRLAVDRGHGGFGKGFAAVFRLGTRHIAEGTDHILFLLTLLLPAPLLLRAHRWGGFGGIRPGLMKIVKVVSAFTIGHSMTLALASTGLVHVPSKPIETLIAVSILVSAVHAIRPVFPGREPLIAACFGFIHGLAFATTLAELGLHGRELAFSIFSFNLGIEAMQLLIVLLVMPSLMLLSTTRVYPGFRVLGGVLAAVAATGWIAERLLGLDLPVDRVVDLIARYALPLAATLFLGSLAAFVWGRRPAANR